MWGHVGPSKGGGGGGYPHPLWGHIGLRHDHVGSFLLYKRNDTPTRLLHFWELQVQSRLLSLQRVNQNTKMASDQPSTSGLSLEEQRAFLQEEDLFDEGGDALMAALPDITSNEVSH